MSLRPHEKGCGRVYMGAVVHVDRPRAVAPTSGAWARRKWYSPTATERLEEAAEAARAAARTSALNKAHDDKTLFEAVQDWLAGGVRREQAESEWGPITHWNTTKVRTLRHLFRGASSFDATLAWDTRNVLMMDELFYGASAFTNGGKPLLWDVSSVLSTRGMFEDASAFDQTLVWDLRGATDVEHMFTGSSGTLVDFDGLDSVWDACYAVDLFERMNEALLAEERKKTFVDKTEVLIVPLVNAHPSIRRLYGADGDCALRTGLSRKRLPQLHDFYVDAINAVRMYVTTKDNTSTCRERTRQLADALLDKLLRPASTLVKDRARRSPYRQRPTVSPD